MKYELNVSFSWDRATQTDILDWIAFNKQPLVVRFMQRLLNKFTLELFQDEITGDYFKLEDIKDISYIQDHHDEFPEFFTRYNWLHRSDLDKVMKSINLS